jgi:hemoglobin-like flavoprotein
VAAGRTHTRGVTPDQVDAVETSLAIVPFDELADRFYAHLFELDPSARAMFPADLVALRRKFGAELELVAMAIRHHDDFLERVRGLAAVHRHHGVRSGHVRVGGVALLAAFVDVLGADWTTDSADAWALAYHLTTEAMLTAMAAAPPDDERVTISPDRATP